MITNEFVKDLNIKNPLGSGGVLASTYAELMKEMWVGNYNYISAWDLKKIIG
jgi:ubiquitin carboxyl-terminal hydrolase 4/11/15